MGLKLTEPEFHFMHDLSKQTGVDSEVIGRTLVAGIKMGMERAAKICQGLIPSDGDDWGMGWESGCERCVEVIRARIEGE